MLVLSRKVGETIEIGGGITVMVVRIAEGVVRLGFKAPKDVPIMRTELVCSPGKGRAA